MYIYHIVEIKCIYFMCIEFFDVTASSDTKMRRNRKQSHKLKLKCKQSRTFTEL